MLKKNCKYIYKDEFRKEEILVFQIKMRYGKGMFLF